MKTILEYINESFFDDDKSLESVTPDKQEAAKFEILLKKFNKIGDEVQEDAESTQSDAYRRMIINYATSDKQESKFRELLAYRVEGDTDEQKQERRYKNTLSAANSIINRLAKDDYGIESMFGAIALLAKFGKKFLTPAYSEKLIGKMCTKFNKEYGTDISAVDRIYNMKKAEFTQHKSAHDAEQKTIEGIKNDFKNHKYTIFASNTEGSAQMFIVNNTKFDSLEDAYAEVQSRKCVEFEGYDLDKLLKSIHKDGKVNGFYLCSGYYTWGKDEAKVIPMFGYYDDSIKGKIYKYSSYDKKFYFRGKVSDNVKNNVYEYYDSLWHTYSDK